MHPQLLGLPSEMTEVLPLLQDLRVRVIAEDQAVERFFLDCPVPSFVETRDREEIEDLLGSADLVLPFLRRNE